MLARAKTLVWNGPFGAFEMEPFDNGTVEVAEAAAELTAARQAGHGRRRRRHRRGAQCRGRGRPFHLCFHRRRRLPGMAGRQAAAGGRSAAAEIEIVFYDATRGVGREGEWAMNLDDLNKVAVAMTAPGKGILAADESTGTIGKRFDAIKTENTEDNRRDYREMMFRTAEAMKNNISGVILYDETIWQKAKDGTPLVDIIKASGALPGIKVDEGVKPLPNCPGEVVTYRPRRPADPAAEILRARRALCEMAGGDRYRRRHSELCLHPRQCTCAGALRRALPGRADRADRRAGSADGRRPRHRALRRGHDLGAEGNLPGIVLQPRRARRHGAQAEYDRAGQEVREAGLDRRSRRDAPSRC